MAKATTPNLLASYHAFVLARVLRIESVETFLAANTVVAGLFLLLFLIGSSVDESFFLPGDGVGLLEHPAIFSFILMQLVSVRVTVGGIESFSSAVDTETGCLKKTDRESRAAKLVESHIRNFVELKTPVAVALFTLFSVVGFICFAWNSFQNQRPQEFLGFDYWDSIHYPFGYWSTRAYKVYLWIFLGPALVHVWVAIITAFWRVMGKVRDSEEFRLQPFHEDNCGGASGLLTPFTGIIYPVLLAGALGTLSAAAVHREIDATPLIGATLLFLISIGLFLGYCLPLRRAIIESKSRLLATIANRQENLFQKVVDGNMVTMSKAEYELAVLDKGKKALVDLPTWPMLRSMLKFAGVVTGSQYAAFVAKMIAPGFVAKLLSFFIGR